MLIGKAKVPSDLHNVLHQQPAPAKPANYRTIEHRRTSSSFVNSSFHDYGPGKMSPLEIDTGRHSLFAANRKLSPKHFAQKASPLQKRTNLISNALSQENIKEVKPKKIKKQTSSRVHTENRGDYINVQSGPAISNGEDYTTNLEISLANARSHRRNHLLTTNTQTNANYSEMSTTVIAPSLAHVKKTPSMGNGFVELGAGLISEATPRSKRSLDVKPNAFRQSSNRNSTMLRNKTNTVSKTNLNAMGDPKRRYSMVKSVSKAQIRTRASSRNLINPGGLTHFNFI